MMAESLPSQDSRDLTTIGSQAAGIAPAAESPSAGMEAVLTKPLSSKARARLLRLFLIDPRRPYYQRQIEADTGIAIRGVQRELERLCAVGLVYRWDEGNRSYYPTASSARPASPSNASLSSNLSAAQEIPDGRAGGDPAGVFT